MTFKNTILVVDDESCVRKLCQRILQRMDHEYLEASTGKDGLRLMMEHTEIVDAIFMDINLPDGPGNEWAHKIREIRSDIPIIFFSGSNSPEFCGPQNTNNFSFVKKPFIPKSIQAALEQVLV